MRHLKVQIVSKLTQMQDAIAVRRAVFIDEQRVPASEEIDAHDGDPAVVASAVHVVAYHDRRPVATARLLLDTPVSGQAHIGRVAVVAKERGRGFGKAVMIALHSEAQRRGYPGITLAAQLQAIPFYERLGYVSRGDVFLDAGIEHRWMDFSFE